MFLIATVVILFIIGIVALLTRYISKKTTPESPLIDAPINQASTGSSIQSTNNQLEQEDRDDYTASIVGSALLMTMMEDSSQQSQVTVEDPPQNSFQGFGEGSAGGAGAGGSYEIEDNAIENNDDSSNDDSDNSDYDSSDSSSSDSGGDD